MTQSFRLPQGGLIDRSRPLPFRFNGTKFQGYEGDTLASALLANGVHHVARSIKYHRPRGIMSDGLEEPSALLTVTDERGTTPNLKATEVPLRAGLEAVSQNHWPSLRHDLGSILQAGSQLLSAGFYYKSFMWPRNAWHRHYERIIRRMAGHGVVDTNLDGTSYDKRQMHCDILVIGTGPAGMTAAITAARAGATTVIVERDTRLGGSHLRTGGIGQGISQDIEKELRSISNVRLLSGALAFGIYDHGLALVTETRPDAPARAIMWKIRARRILLASGAIEKPLVFPGNDRPGILLAGAVRSYIHRYAVRPGTRAVLAIANPTELNETKRALQEAEIAIASTVEDGDTLLRAKGRAHLSGIVLQRSNGQRETLACDLLCVSGGWAPAAHLFSHAGGKLVWRDRLGLVPEGVHSIVTPIGGARGTFEPETAREEGRAAAQQALGELHIHKPMPANLSDPVPPEQISFATGRGKAFADLQNDVTRADIAQAVREGYEDVELVKRYTTLGMGTDQGKTSWTNGIEEVAQITGRATCEIGHTTFRPPYSPVSIGALVGAETGQNMVPARRTPFHRAFETVDCVFQTSGDWLYSRYFASPGENMADAVAREVIAVRSSLGCVDMSTLGKFEVRGADALTFLSRVYCNGIAAIKPGRLRYGLMLREDGIVFDDGTISCIAPDHFLVTATTANAGSVWRHLRKLVQVDWPELNVHLTDVSAQWASLAIAGPRARDLLNALSPDFETSSQAFPFASVRESMLGGDLPLRAFSVSFSGELSYELNVPAGFAETLFARVMTEGAKWSITPYGLEALDVLRIEKGHLSIGTEIDGRRTPDDLGLGRMVSKKKDFLGKALLARAALQAPDRPQLVGLKPIELGAVIPPGGHLTAKALTGRVQTILGFLTAAVNSPTLGHNIALAYLDSGHTRYGERLWVTSPVAGVSTEVEVTSPHFYDPDGERLHG
ncbi:2Fe-2S iron-sulfur cluster-binding protein [Phaeobacter sp. C3_T13_0]|uniref:2Fe-2S iron-sulfur cluster-binding protein n=1 Tax=Phaeobacter cretensis TaxID=3342641 RepID=UPI0039BD18E2